MADAFDALMKSIADEADAKVDYAAMHAAVLQKAAAMRRRRAQFVRYGAMAATLVVLAGVGTLFLRARGDAARSGENAAPQTVEFSMGDGGCARRTRTRLRAGKRVPHGKDGRCGGGVRRRGLQCRAE